MLDSKEILMLQSNSFKIKHFNCNKKGKRVAHFRIGTFNKYQRVTNWKRRLRYCL